ncbi:MAG: hypothetical protein KAJ91_00200 [Candidatus Aenigmarchaeota archaeon]|nr:hypothetical protein [Candidatus Aenigmarchaeota archaeon]
MGKPQSCKGCTFNKAKPNGVKCHLDGKCPTCKGTGVVKEEDLLAFEKAYGSPDAS